MLTDSPPSKARLAAFTHSDRIHALTLPPPGEFVRLTQSIEAAMKTGKTQEVRAACEVYRGQEYAVDLLPKIKVEVVLPDNLVEPAVAAIIKSPWTHCVGLPMPKPTSSNSSTLTSVSPTNQK